MCWVGSNANAHLPERGRPGGHSALECAQPDKKANSWHLVRPGQYQISLSHEPSRQSPMWSSLSRTGWHWRPQSGRQEKPRTGWHRCSQSATQEKPAKSPGSVLLPRAVFLRICWLSSSESQRKSSPHHPSLSKSTLRSRSAHTCPQAKSFKGKS